MRVLTWNCRRAKAGAPLWEVFRRLDPDVAILQEVGGLPPDMEASYDCRFGFPLSRKGVPQRFRSCLLVKGTVGARIELRGGQAWVGEELERYSGNVLAHEVRTRCGESLRVFGVYNPAWPIDVETRLRVDASSVRLSLANGLWLADLLSDALRTMRESLPGPLVVAGDFNLSESFDYLWKGGPRGNAEYLERMAALGLTDALRHHQGRLTPTFRSPRGGSVLHQIDHLFVSDDLLARLSGCKAHEEETVFGSGLSDHLPVVAEFRR